MFLHTEKVLEKKKFRKVLTEITKSCNFDSTLFN